jgi:hypothetical protein
MHARRRIATVAGCVTAFGAAGLVGSMSASALPSNCAGTTTVSCTFSYNGTDGTDGSAQDWTVPDGVTSARFSLRGAQGGGEADFSQGGLGGETDATVALVPGTTVTVFVGGHGSFHGGFNGGGGGDGYGGGGASDIRIGGTTLSDRVLVAGGGGGGAFYDGTPPTGEMAYGGSGGGSAGGHGTSAPSGAYTSGEGGTQVDGGSGATSCDTSYPTGSPGFSGSGGAGAEGFLAGGGGGGGGFFGGGGGCTVSGQNHSIGSGGGGSGYVLPDTVRATDGSMSNGIQLGNGVVTLTYTAPATPPPPPSGKPSIRIADASGAEGNSGTHTLAFHVTMGKASTSPVTVHWATAKGTAQSPSDFVAASGTLTFAPGQRSKNVAVAIKVDRVKEPNEVFYVLLSNPHNATIADPNASGGILNDD